MSLGLLRIASGANPPADCRPYRFVITQTDRRSLLPALLSRSPQTQFLCYKNATWAATWGPGVSWAEAQKHPEWWLLDTNGQRVSSSGWAYEWLLDPGHVGYQRAWLAAVLADLRQGKWQGVFMDDVNADLSSHLGGRTLAKYPTRFAWREAMGQFLAFAAVELRQAGYLVLANVGAKWDQPTVWAQWARYANGLMLEHFLKWGEGREPVFTGNDWTLHTEALRSVIGHRMRDGHWPFFCALTYGTSDYTAAQEYVRASLLLFTGQGDSTTFWNGPGDEGAGAWQHELGAPFGPARQAGAVWARRFERGSVSVDTAAGRARFT